MEEILKGPFLQGLCNRIGENKLGAWKTKQKELLQKAQVSKIFQNHKGNKKKILSIVPKYSLPEFSVTSHFAFPHDQINSFEVLRCSILVFFPFKS
jgi:hypothetical protein